MKRFGFLISTASTIMLASAPLALADSVSVSASSDASSTGGPQATLDIVVVGAGASGSGSVTATANGAEQDISHTQKTPGHFHGEASSSVTSRADRK
jgi:hypothetical protein